MLLITPVFTLQLDVNIAAVIWVYKHLSYNILQVCLVLVNQKLVVQRCIVPLHISIFFLTKQYFAPVRGNLAGNIFHRVYIIEKKFKYHSIKERKY